MHFVYVKIIYPKSIQGILRNISLIEKYNKKYIIFEIPNKCYTHEIINLNKTERQSFYSIFLTFLFLKQKQVLDRTIRLFFTIICHKLLFKN